MPHCRLGILATVANLYSLLPYLAPVHKPRAGTIGYFPVRIGVGAQPRTLRKLAEALGVEPHELMKGEE
jgi:hypothetical protein